MIPPLTPAAPVWICAALIVLADVRFRIVKFIATVPPVMALFASRVGVMVIVASPVAAGVRHTGTAVRK